MGFETKVLNAIEEFNVNVRDNASFYNGTLFIENSNDVTTGDIFKVVEMLKSSVVLCEMKTSRVGNEIAIDFV